MVKRTTVAAAALVVGIAAGLACAVEPSGTDSNAPRTLAEYLTYAAFHNAGLQASGEEWKAALEQIPQAKALPDPRFTYDYFIEQIQTRQQVGIMQTFPWFGKIAARTDAAAAAAKAAQKRYDARRLQLVLSIKDAFHEYAYLDSARRITGENLELMRHIEEVTRARHLAAASTHPDIIRAQIEVAELQNELISTEKMREPIVARLNAVLNRPSDAPLPWPTPEPVRPVTLDRPTLRAALTEQNPEIQAAGFDVERLRREVDVTKRSFYPDIGVGVEWMKMNMGPGARDDDVRLGVELNLPIWRGSYRAGELQARAMARRAQHDRQELENSLAARVERALYEFENSGRQASLYDQTLVPNAKELIGASEAAYLAGTIDFLSLIEAQRTLLRYRLEEERALATQRQKLAELEMLVGTDLTGPMAESSPGGLPSGSTGGTTVEQPK
jgi:outer membrane protein, heavy metal efflux system